MLKKRIRYTDYDGNVREEDFYFNLSKAELMKLLTSEAGGLDVLIQKIIDERDSKRIYALFEQIVKMSYGEKSLDGKHFVKSEEISELFTQTEAYSELIMEFFQNPKAVSDFIAGIAPSDMKDAVMKAIEEKEKEQEAEAASLPSA